MAEQEPGFQPQPKDERDVAAKLKRQYEKAQFDADQKEEFGKFDVTTPNKGEDTYQSYLDQRPADGILRDGEGYRDTQTGRFAGEQAYTAQVGDTQAYYDRVGGIENNGEYTAPDYEQMGVMQLAKAAAEARLLGDKAEETTIREALEHYLTADIMKDDTESPEQAQARYDAEVERYEALVEQIIDRNGRGSSHTESPSEPVEAANVGSSEPAAAQATNETTPPAAKEATKAPVEEDENEEYDDKAEAAEQPATDTPTEPGAYHEGKKISVARVEEDESGDKTKDRLTIIDEDGNQKIILARDVQYVKGLQVENKAAEKTPGKEVELYRPERKEIVAVEQEKARSWWQKAGDSIRMKAGEAYWKAQWAFDNYVMQPAQRLIDYKVEDSMSDEEKEKQRRKNRYAVIGTTAAIGLVIGGGILLGQVDHLHGATEAATTLTGAGSEASTGAVDGAGNGLLSFELPTNTDTSTAEGVKQLPIVGAENAESEVIDSVDPSTIDFEVGKGEGGEALFERLHIDPEKWYSVERTLYTQFPDHFYEMPDGHIGILNSGDLPTGADAIINSLR